MKAKVSICSWHTVFLVLKPTLGNCSIHKSVTVETPRTPQRPTVMSSIRACFPYNFRWALTLEKNKFTGVYSELMNKAVDYFEFGGNISLQIRSSNDLVGEKDPSTGLYSGCIGQLQRNQSDVLLSPVDYSMDVDQVDQGDIGYDIAEQFLSTYVARSMKERESIQLESCFKSFDECVWSMCVCTVVVVYLLLIIRRSFIIKAYSDTQHRIALLNRTRGTYIIRRGRNLSSMKPGYKINVKKRIINRYYLTKVLLHMTRQGSLDNSTSLFKKLVFTICSFFSLLVVQYFCSLIKTELVTIAPPEIYKSYQELVDRNVTLFFAQGFTHYVSFKFAPAGSVKKKLWQASIKDRHEREYMMGWDQAERAVAQINKLFSRKVVFMVDSGIAQGILKFFCQFSYDSMTTEYLSKLNISYGAVTPYPARSQDARVRVVTKGIIYSAHIIGSAKKQLRKRLRRFFEYGFVLKAMNDFNEKDVINFFVPNRGLRKGKTLDKVLECSQGAIETPDVNVSGIELDNMRNIICFSLALFSISAVILYIEYRLQRRRRL